MKTNAILSFLFTATFLFLCCNSPSSSNSTGCGIPTINACSGDPCVYIHIHNENGNFIKESSGSLGGSMGGLYWDGTDCRGNKVGCGKYTITMHIVAYGQKTTQKSAVLLADSNTISKTGRSACDSLKNNCTGNYAEAPAAVLGAGEDVGCICCQ